MTTPTCHWCGGPLHPNAAPTGTDDIRNALCARVGDINTEMKVVESTPEAMLARFQSCVDRLNELEALRARVVAGERVEIPHPHN